MARQLIGKPQSLPRVMIHALLTLSSFLLVSSWIQRGVPWPEALDVRAKLQAFAETKDEYDAIYVGSSRIFRGIRPEIIDPLVSARGETFKSYNLGLPGMWSFEADHLLDEMLALEPAKLEWVVIEAPLWKADLFSSIRNVNERSVRWHTAASTAQALRSIWLEDHTFAEKLRVSWQHFSQLARRSGNYALGPSWWQAHVAPQRPEFEASVREYRESRGYRALESFELPGARARRRSFLRKRADYLDAVGALSRVVERGGQPDQRTGSVISLPGVTEAAGNSLEFEHFNLAALQSQQARLAARNLKVVYTVPPQLTPGRLFVDLHRRGELSAIFDYAQPTRYPELFTLESHFDFWHLSQPGALRYSELIAGDLLASIQGARGQ